MQAKVKVLPETEAGKVIVECIGEPKREPCEGILCQECDFMISQLICLRIPIMFSAEAEVVKQGIVCEHQSEDCEPDPCDEMRRCGGFPARKRHKEKDHASPFAWNIRLTNQNNL